MKKELIIINRENKTLLKYNSVFIPSIGDTISLSETELFIVENRVLSPTSDIILLIGQIK